VFSILLLLFNIVFALAETTGEVVVMVWLLLRFMMFMLFLVLIIVLNFFEPGTDEDSAVEVIVVVIGLFRTSTLPLFPFLNVVVVAE
jgi:hypothetical protein